MKFATIFWILVSRFVQHRVIADDSQQHSLRGFRRLRVQYPCTLVNIETQYKNELANDEDESRKLQSYGEDNYKCELQEEDRRNVGKYFVSINGIESDQFNNVTSGETTIMVDGAMIMDGTLYIPAGAAVEFGTSQNNNNRRLQQASRTKGTKKVLVVRANGNGASTTATKETLSDNIFGTNGDNATLHSQYLACSHGKLDFQPFRGQTLGGTYIDNGVLEVDIDIHVPGASRYEVEDALEEAADALVGDFRQQFDHIMLCLPPGTSLGSSNNWVAYGYVNSWLSVYNDVYCQKLSTQVHEMGHNLGLSHSSKDGVSYGDKSGMMGYSYNRENGPLQCFNPAKNFILGWYEDQVIEVDPFEGTWTGSLVGVTEYGDNDTRNSYIVVKIKTDGENFLFVGYNRKKGMNSGVELAGDNIVIVEQAPGYSKSDFKAKLSGDNSTKTFYNIGGSDKNLVVNFLDHGSSLDEAVLAIYFDDCIYPSCCIGPMCNISTPSESTQISVLQPTPSPTRKRLYTAYEPNNQRNPEQLLLENFRSGLGAFNAGGTRVKRTIFESILTAQFEMKQSDQLPFMSTDLDLKGNSIIQVYFWYNAETMQSSEGFVLQYSASGGNTWADVGKWRYEDEFSQLNKWNKINAATFTVSEGTTSVRLRFKGDTTKANDSMFYIASVDIYGTKQ
mmetsp:Transcript_32943/g.36717  ORF Transcript_32943/g.36717 Transcript_32943/m.36717 type:complete len:675 (+) Transcript_32943:119-2143(+)